MDSNEEALSEGSRKYMHEPVASTLVAVQMNLLEKLMMKHFMNASLAMRL